MSVDNEYCLFEPVPIVICHCSQLNGKLYTSSYKHLNQSAAKSSQIVKKCKDIHVTGFAKRYLFHVQNLTHFVNLKAS